MMKVFQLKKQSEQLLELAKTAVEKAIEEDEGVAMEFIKENYSKIMRIIKGLKNLVP